MLGAIAILAACADDASTTDEGTSEAHVEVATAVVIADEPAVQAAEVTAGRIRLPAAFGSRYAALPPGTIFVGARAKATGARAPEAPPQDDTTTIDAGPAPTPDADASVDADPDAGVPVPTPDPDSGAPPVEVDAGPSPPPPPPSEPYAARNPDGFLRRVVAARTEGGLVVIDTTPASIPDAIVNGSVQTSSSRGAFDVVGSSRHFKVDLDLGNESLFENVDEVTTEAGTTHLTELVRLERARMYARPTVDVDLKIFKGKVTHFIAKMEGQVETSIAARAEVTADGPADRDALTLLRARHHAVRKVVYESGRVPLPTIMVGRVPVSASVAFTVTMKCDLAFGGPLAAKAAVESKSYVRVGAVQDDGVWAPVRSDFDLRSSFSIERGVDADARCALETAATVTAFDTPGLALTIAPFVDFEVGQPPLRVRGPDAKLDQLARVGWRANAGATGMMRGSADVFGLGALDQTLAEWSAGAPATGRLDP
jgi:hypothetical protein